MEDDDEDEGDDDDDDGDDHDGYIWWEPRSNKFHISIIYRVRAYWELPSCPQIKWF